MLRSIMKHTPALTGLKHTPALTVLRIPAVYSLKFRTFHANPQLYARPSLGDTASITRTFTPSEVQQFAVLSGDTNSLHTGEKLSEDERSPTEDSSAPPGDYAQPIAHGILTLGVFSAIMGTQLPGEGTVMHGLDVMFPAPLYVGEAFTARVEVIELKKRFATMSLLCTARESGKVVAKGTARVYMPKE